MNEAQYKIVKAMQGIGINPTRFAAACNVKVNLMIQAYNSLNYDQFVSKLNDDSDINDAMESLFGKGI